MLLLLLFLLVNVVVIVVGFAAKTVINQVRVDEAPEILIAFVPLQIDQRDILVVEAFFLPCGRKVVVGERDDVAGLGVVDDRRLRIGLVQLGTLLELVGLHGLNLTDQNGRV